MMTDTVTGFSCGRIMLQNVRRTPAPSMAAASSSATGMELMKFVYR